MKYELPRDGMDAQVHRERERADVIRDLRGSNKLESATIGSGGLTVKDGGRIALLDDDGDISTLLEQGFIFQADPVTTAAVQIANGNIWMWGNREANPNNYGRLTVDPGNSNIGRWFPPYSDGDGLANSLTVQGRRPGLVGRVWAYSDGGISLNVQDPGGTRVGDITLRATKVEIQANQLPLYELPTTSATANVALTTVGGQWTLALVTSSRRYKTNIEPVAIDPASVLAVEVVKYNDVVDMGVEGFPAPDRYGVIAEQAHEHVSEFVPLDDEGRPNAFDYDRFSSVGHQIVLKDHEARLAEVEAENAELRSTIAALTTRIEALEAL